MTKGNFVYKGWGKGLKQVVKFQDFCHIFVDVIYKWSFEIIFDLKYNKNSSELLYRESIVHFLRFFASFKMFNSWSPKLLVTCTNKSLLLRLVFWKRFVVIAIMMMMMMIMILCCSKWFSSQFLSDVSWTITFDVNSGFY